MALLADQMPHPLQRYCTNTHISWSLVINSNDAYDLSCLCGWYLQVVGSHSWPLISRYRAAVRTQSSKVEMIESLFKPSPNGEDDDGIMRYIYVIYLPLLDS